MGKKFDNGIMRFEGPGPLFRKLISMRANERQLSRPWQRKKNSIQNPIMVAFEGPLVWHENGDLSPGHMHLLSGTTAAGDRNAGFRQGGFRRAEGSKPGADYSRPAGAKMVTGF